MRKAPISVIVIACLYLVVGAAGLAGDFSHFAPPRRFSYDAFIPVVHLLAITCAVFMLRADNWARWFAVVWIAFHVVVGALDSWYAMAIHALLCAVIVYILFRPAANRYFRAAGPEIV